MLRGGSSAPRRAAPGDAMSFISELKRRNVIRMAGLYLVGAWLVVQVAGTLLPMFEAPAWLPRSIAILLAIGFLPALVFSWIFEFTPGGLKRDADVAPQDSIAPRTARRLDRAIIAVLLLALVCFAFDRLVLEPRREAAFAQRAGAAAAAPAPDIDEDSIAVLPLANESGDQDEQYFSDGISEDLITALSQFGGLKVISRNSSFLFRDSREDSRVIGARLGVANLLEGSVRRAGDVVRVSAALVKAIDGSTLWSQHYDRPYRDLFKLQDDITAAVAAELKAKLLGGTGGVAQTDRPASGNLQAYDAWAKGEFLLLRNTEADLHASIVKFTEATRIDPRYANAWASLSRASTLLAAEFAAGVQAQQAIARGRDAVATALSLEPDLATAHTARAYLLFTADLDWRGAENEYRRALQLAPDDEDARIGMSLLLASLGRLDEAVAQARRALAIDPLRPRNHLWLGLQLAALGSRDEAVQELRKAIDLQPTAAALHSSLAYIQIQRGDEAAALAAALAEPPGIWQDIALGMARQAGSDRAAADAALATLTTRHADGAAYQIAQVYALRREPDAMFEWLDRAWDHRDPGIQFLLYDPFVLRYRSDPRFAAFCRKVGLPESTQALP